VTAPALDRLQRQLQQQGDGAELPLAEGPAFPAPVKALATILVLTLALWGAMVLADPGASLPDREGWAFLCAACAVVAFGYGHILFSRTRFDGRGITQSGLWRKHVALSEITQLKLICVPGLTWLIVPRLVVRADFGLTNFCAGDPAVLAQFRRLAYGDPPTECE
jgi:hypothetical protein